MPVFFVLPTKADKSPKVEGSKIKIAKSRGKKKRARLFAKEEEQAGRRKFFAKKTEQSALCSDVARVAGFVTSEAQGEGAERVKQNSMYPHTLSKKVVKQKERKKKTP